MPSIVRRVMSVEDHYVDSFVSRGPRHSPVYRLSSIVRRPLLALKLKTRRAHAAAGRGIGGWNTYFNNEQSDRTRTHTQPTNILTQTGGLNACG